MTASRRSATRAAARLTLVLWGAILAFVASVTVFTGQVEGPADVITLFTGVLAGLGFSALLYAAFRRMSDRSQLAWIVTLGAGVIVAAILQTVFEFTEDRVLAALFENVTIPPLNLGTALLTTLIYLCIYGCNAAIFWITESAQRTREREKLAREQAVLLARAQTLAARLELERLRLQINPHFMCNALGAVSSLIDAGRRDDAEAMADKLAHFLSDVIQDNNVEATVHDEFAMLKAYLEVEAVRFNERLAVVFDRPDDLALARLPQFILQPLVENAMHHAVEPSPGLVTLRITARRDGGDLVLAVSDNGGVAAAARPRAGKGRGIGLANTRARLAMRYGDAASLETSPMPGGYRSTIRLPLELAVAG